MIAAAAQLNRKDGERHSEWAGSEVAHLDRASWQNQGALEQLKGHSSAPLKPRPWAQRNATVPAAILEISA